MVLKREAQCLRRLLPCAPWWEAEGQRSEAAARDPDANIFIPNMQSLKFQVENNEVLNFTQDTLSFAGVLVRPLVVHAFPSAERAACFQQRLRQP